MSEETKTASESLPYGGSADDFEQLIYWVSAKRDAFDVENFRAHLPTAVSQLDDSAVTLSSKDADGRYHAFFSWTITADALEFKIEYHSGHWQRASGEPEPYAEDFMSWFGQFFAASVVKCHVHARFVHPLEKRRNTFALALSEQPPHGAELYGVALRLPNKPLGVSSVRITQGKTRWYSEVVLKGSISFNAFTPYSDVTTSLLVLASFLEGSAS